MHISLLTSNMGHDDEDNNNNNNNNNEYFHISSTCHLFAIAY